MSAALAGAAIISTSYIVNNAAWAALPQYDHVVVVIEENHGQSQIIGDTTDAPYINSLFGCQWWRVIQ